MPSEQQQQWLDAAIASLITEQGSNGGWPYALGQAASTEPTALSCLALHTIAPTSTAIVAGCQWLLAQQEPSGHFRPITGLMEPTWPTPLAALVLNSCGYPDPMSPAIQALLDEPVYSLSRERSASLFGYNTELRGWPWTAGGFSFIEPTAMAMLLLKRAGYGQHPRVREATAMLRDRAIAGSGWNYGESVVLNGQLFPTVLSTSYALLALADEQDDITATAVDWLALQHEQSFSFLSHGWAMIALKLYERLTTDWTDAFLANWQVMPPERNNVAETALGVLAMGPLQDPLEVLT